MKLIFISKSSPLLKKTFGKKLCIVFKAKLDGSKDKS